MSKIASLLRNGKLKSPPENENSPRRKEPGTSGANGGKGFEYSSGGELSSQHSSCGRSNERENCIDSSQKQSTTGSRKTSGQKMATGSKSRNPPVLLPGGPQDERLLSLGGAPTGQSSSVLVEAVEMVTHVTTRRSAKLLSPDFDATANRRSATNAKASKSSPGSSRQVTPRTRNHKQQRTIQSPDGGTRHLGSRGHGADSKDAYVPLAGNRIAEKSVISGSVGHVITEEGGSDESRIRSDSGWNDKRILDRKPVQTHRRLCPVHRIPVVTGSTPVVTGSNSKSPDHTFDPSPYRKLKSTEQEEGAARQFSRLNFPASGEDGRLEKAVKPPEDHCKSFSTDVAAANSEQVVAQGRWGGGGRVEGGAVDGDNGYLSDGGTMYLKRMAKQKMRRQLIPLRECLENSHLNR